MKRQSVLRGAVWLMLSALLAKLLGAGFRIPLTALLGGTGMGYFSCAYGLFLPVFALSVTGINTAVATLTAQSLARDDEDSAATIAKTARRLFGRAGLVGSILLFLLAEPLCTHALHNPEAAPAVRMFAPAIWLCCVCAVLRGEQEGRQDMIPTAVSQVTEGIARVFFGLVLTAAVLRNTGSALRLFPKGTPPEAAGAAAAVLGVTLSAAAGLLTVRFFRQKPHRKVPDTLQKKRQIRRKLLRLLLPVAAASLVTNLTSLIDLATGLRGLAAGILRNPAAHGLSPDAAVSEAAPLANFYFGAYSGLAMTVFNLIPSVTNMLGKAVLPAFAEQSVRQNHAAMQRHAEDVLRRTAFLAVPAGMGVCVLSHPILMFLFGSRPLEVQISAPALSLLGIAVIFTAMSGPLFSMMQAAGYAGDTVTVMLYGAGIKLAGNLLMIPRMGLRGAAAATVLCYVTVFFGARYLFARRTGIVLRLRTVCGAAGIAGIGCTAAAGSLYFRLAAMPQKTALLLSICAGTLVYLLLYLLLTKRLLKHKTAAL